MALTIPGHPTDTRCTALEAFGTAHRVIFATIGDGYADCRYMIVTRVATALMVWRTISVPFTVVTEDPLTNTSAILTNAVLAA